MALITRLCLLSVLCLLVSQTHGLPTSTVTDCSAFKNQRETVRGVFRAMAGADIVLQSEPMTITKDDVDLKQVIPVRVACLLKGQPGAVQLNVRLVHNATRCFDSETLDTVITHNQNGAFVLALNHAANDSLAGWELMDGGLFNASIFYKPFSQVKCNASAIHGGSCSSNVGSKGCEINESIVKNLGEIEKKLPYVYASQVQHQKPLQPPPQPSPESPKQQQQQQHDQQETDSGASGMLASDQPAATAAKKLGDSDSVVSDKGNSAAKAGPVQLQLIFFAALTAAGGLI